jgi:predicted SAM-dependent methyltransferase
MMKIHLGCGNRKLDGYVNVDARPDAAADEVADVGALPFPDGSVALIYACHVLEHVPRPDLAGVLAEWRRVLRPDGTLRLAVPDFKALAALYAKGVPLWRLVGPLHGRQNYPENTHFVAFDYDYLAWHLTEAGFHSVRRWTRTSASWDFPVFWDDYSRAEIDGVPISLNVEATR